jgi:hypothetical protein
MKYKIITSLACLLFIFFASGQQPALPVRQVLEKFFDVYEIHAIPYGYVEFEKRRGDWYVKTIDNVNGKFVKGKPLLFYNAQQKSFVVLEFEKRTSNEKINYERFVPEPMAYEYDLHPYYGYSGWYKDVIKEYGSGKDLTDTELYSLGRAYSSRAIEPVTNQWNDADPADLFDLPFKRDAFTDKQLQQYTASVDSAIVKFRQLALRKPEFQTRVGDIRDKYANEVMFKFHILLTFSEKGFRQMSLQKGVYKDSILSIARSYLNACPPQSIFVSMGDNDFYPLLYVQHTEGFRKDVYVVNYNLLAVDKFIYRMSHAQFDAQPIRISADTSMYMGNTNEIIFLKDTSASISASQLTRFIQTAKADEDGRKNLDANSIELPWKNKDKISTKVTVKLAGKYLLRHHWVLLDMINNLNGRVLCLPIKLEDELKGLSSYLYHCTKCVVYTYNQ